jgi:hypothetical protein
MMKYSTSGILLTTQATFCQAAIALTLEDYLVKGLEKVEPAFESFDGVMFAGMIPTTLLSELNNDDGSPGKLMFWLFAPNKPVHDDPVCCKITPMY